MTNLISKYVEILQEGTSMVPDRREDTANFLNEEETELSENLQDILEAIADLEEDQNELDEMIQEFEEGARIQSVVRHATMGVAGKHGAVMRYKRARAAGVSKAGSIKHGAKSVVRSAVYGVRTAGDKRDLHKQKAAGHARKANDATIQGDDVKAAKHKLKQAKQQRKVDRSAHKVTVQDR